jgi:hypothetical protein
MSSIEYGVKMFRHLSIKKFILRNESIVPFNNIIVEYLLIIFCCSLVNFKIWC